MVLLSLAIYLSFRKREGIGDEIFLFSLFKCSKSSVRCSVVSFDYCAFAGMDVDLNGRVDRISEDVSVDGESRVLVLSTCIEDIKDGRYVVFAKLSEK